MRSIRKPNRIILAGAVWCSLALGAAGQDEAKPVTPVSLAEIEAKVTEVLDAFDLTPQPAAEIPDDPPPHEGAMIDQPEYRIEPPDLVLIEVLEALPGRPISGERLVRADGTVSLGFYGDVHVRGLTLRQAKVKIIKHLRGILSDEVLGLLYEEWSQPRAEPTKADEPAWTPPPPEKSGRIFVDVTAYNSKHYHVMGDVPAPGKLPITGNETVLDALENAGGLLNTADPHDVRLVRPGRDGKPGKVYKVDLEAIRDRGETATNYQIFPGDRLVVGRDEVVEKTAEMERLTAAIKTVFAAIGPRGDLGREMERRGGAVLDAQALRDAILRALQANPAEPKDDE